VPPSSLRSPPRRRASSLCLDPGADPQPAWRYPR
jgi:hypothetical protein